jgi:hypothetical protein
VNCGPVGTDVRNEAGKPVEEFSVKSWLDLQDTPRRDRANPPVYGPDDVPF